MEKREEQEKKVDKEARSTAEAFFRLSRVSQGKNVTGRREGWRSRKDSRCGCGGIHVRERL